MPLAKATGDLDTNEEGTLPSTSEPLTFWDDKTWECPFENCMFVSPFVEPSIIHLKFNHQVEIENLKDITPFFIEYTSEIYQKQPNSNIWSDNELLQEIQIRKINELICIQQNERNSRYAHFCLFCRSVGKLEVKQLFAHMLSDHGFYIGDPDNLVNINLFLDGLRAKLDKCVCLMCDRTFKNLPTLRKHMRKWKHCKLNPKNEFFDRFYLTNYTILRSQAKQIIKEEDEDNCNFDEWEESLQGITIM